MLWFFVSVWRIAYRALATQQMSEYHSALVRMGLFIVPAFLAAQITLEFNRSATIDYAQFIFALMGLIVGLSDRGHDTLSRSGASSRHRDQGEYLSEARVRTGRAVG